MRIWQYTAESWRFKPRLFEFQFCPRWCAVLKAVSMVGIELGWNAFLCTVIWFKLCILSSPWTTDILLYLATTTEFVGSLAILVFNGSRLNFETDKWILIYTICQHTDQTETRVTTLSDFLYYVMTYRCSTTPTLIIIWAYHYLLKLTILLREQWMR